MSSSSLTSQEKDASLEKINPSPGLLGVKNVHSPSIRCCKAKSRFPVSSRVKPFVAVCFQVFRY